MPRDRYQSVQEVADRLKVSEATVRHWIKNGHLRAVDIGKARRISDGDLDDFLHRHQTCPRKYGIVDPEGSADRGGNNQEECRPQS